MGQRPGETFHLPPLKTQTFTNRCLYQILKLRWFDKGQNIDRSARAKQKPMDIQIKERKVVMAFCISKDCGNTPQKGKRNRECPRDLEKELTKCSK